jgi:Domain of unknown function (DUF222)/HNH endonuclease
MADVSLTGNVDTGSAGERYQVVVHVEPTEGSYVLKDGPALALETAERLACDASLVEIVERDGVPLSVGLKTRTIPPSIRRALQARDRRCCYPGCENKRFLHAHHIRHWARGGETKLDNLLLICPRHHRFVHEAGYSVRIADGKPEFRDRWGAPVPNVPRPPPGDPRLLVERNRELAIDGKTCACGDGDRMDLGLAVDALLAVAGPKRSTSADDLAKQDQRHMRLYAHV